VHFQSNGIKGNDIAARVETERYYDNHLKEDTIVYRSRVINKGEQIIISA
jgi:hypothetical protein